MPESTYIATAPMPWIDGFITWTKTEVTENVKCCRYHRDTPSEFCPSNFRAETVAVKKNKTVDDSMFENYDQYYFDKSDTSRNRRQSDDYGDYGDYSDYGDYGDYGGNYLNFALI